MYDVKDSLIISPTIPYTENQSGRLRFGPYISKGTGIGGYRIYMFSGQTLGD